MNPRIIRYVPVLFTLLFLGNVYAAQSTASEKGGSSSPSMIEQDMFPPSVQPTAIILLQEMGEYLEKAKHFSFRAKINFDEVLSTDQKIQYSANMNLYVRRPDRARTEYKGDLGTRRSWYDGNTITIHDIRRNNYAEVKVPGKIDMALDHVMEKYNLSFPLADFLYGNPFYTLIQNVDSGYYVGLHEVQGVSAHHLAFRQQSIDWQIWIEDGPQLVPRKITITYKNLPGSPQYTAVLSDWTFNLRLSDLFFVPQIPDGTEKIEFISVLEKEKSLKTTVKTKRKGR